MDIFQRSLNKCFLISVLSRLWLAVINNRNSSACKGKNTTGSIILSVWVQYVVEYIYLWFCPDNGSRKNILYGINNCKLLYVQGNFLSLTAGGCLSGPRRIPTNLKNKYSHIIANRKSALPVCWLLSKTFWFQVSANSFLIPDTWNLIARLSLKKWIS